MVRHVQGKFFQGGALICAALLLTACGSDDPMGNGDGGGNGDGDGAGGPSRGELLADPALVRTVTTSELLTDLNEPVNQALLLQAGAPLCDFAVYKIRYATVDEHGGNTDASGALMAPTGTDARCSGARPAVLYARGTSTDRDVDLTNLDDAQNAEGLLIAAFFASQGFLVIAPNYTGYDTSTLDHHPYLVADAQAADMVDGLAAARGALPVAAASGTTDDGRLYGAGTSPWRRSARSSATARPSRRLRRCRDLTRSVRSSTPCSPDA
jgi:hypothetical protein